MLERRHRTRLSGFHCPRCRYSLRGLRDGDRCPECGRRLDRHEVFLQRRYPGRRIISPKVFFRSLGVLMLVAGTVMFFGPLWIPQPVPITNVEGAGHGLAMSLVFFVLAEFFPDHEGL